MQAKEPGGNTYGPILVALEAVMAKVTLFLFLFILFKMKKIQIMLDMNSNSGSIVGEGIQSERQSLTNISNKLSNFVLISRTFLVLFISTLLFQFVIMVLTILKDSRVKIDKKVVEGLSITIMVAQTLLFLHFTFMIVYFYKMGLWYVKTLRSDQEHLNLFLCQLLFLAMSLLLVLVSFSQFVVLGCLFIINSFAITPSWSGATIAAVHTTWTILEVIEGIAPLLIGWFNLLIITYFAKQVGNGGGSGSGG